jgi:hypothetical protein
MLELSGTIDLLNEHLVHDDGAASAPGFHLTDVYLVVGYGTLGKGCASQEKLLAYLD